MTSKSKKSNMTMTTKKESSVIVKKERSSINEKGKKSLTSLKEDDFAYQFQKLCMDQGITTPNVKTILFEPTPGECFTLRSSLTGSRRQFAVQTEITGQSVAQTQDILIIYDSIDNNLLCTVIIKHMPVKLPLLLVMGEVFNTFNTVSVLKLEYCNLDKKEIDALHEILLNNQTILDLSVNGNSNPYQNFYKLLRNTKVMNLSMSFCKINDRGIKKIADQINKTADPPLIALNISSNFISDQGTIYVASILRGNRTLLSLNLANNWITDTGCITLINVLRIFPLNLDESVIRRTKRMDFLINRDKMIEEQKLRYRELSLTLSATSLSRVRSTSQAKGGRKESRDSHSRKSSKGRSSNSSAHNKERMMSAAEMRKIDQIVDMQITPEEHPFVKDSYTEDMEIYCKGNFKLLHLNLAYNKITSVGVAEIIAMLKYQQYNISNINDGLSHINIEGNPNPDYAAQVTEIQELLDKTQSRRASELSKSSQQSQRRKKSSTGSVKISVAR